MWVNHGKLFAAKCFKSQVFKSRRKPDWQRRGLTPGMGILNQGSLPSKCWGAGFLFTRLQPPDASTQYHSGDAPSNPSCWLFFNWVFLPTDKLHRQGDGCDVTISTLLIGTRKKEKGESGELLPLGSETGQTWVWRLVGEDETTPLRATGFCARHTGLPCKKLDRLAKESHA